MNISATYICPLRGLTTLEAPEPEHLGRAAKIARELGVSRIILPVFEGALLSPPKEKIHYLDGMVRALDQAAAAGIKIALLAPAQHLLGLDWPAPFLVRPTKDPEAPPVFLEKRIRHLIPFAWWQDPLVVQKRIGLFRELSSALSGHPALSTWIIFDRFLDWVQPEEQQADWMLKALSSEIRERDSMSLIVLNLNRSIFLVPDLFMKLINQVDGIRIVGLDKPMQKIDLAGHELFFAAFLGCLGQWLFQKPIEVESGWCLLEQSFNSDRLFQAGSALSVSGLAGLDWANLVDPVAGLLMEPPWNLDPLLAKLSLLDQRLEPKTALSTWLNKISLIKPPLNSISFIDVGQKEYFSDPGTHLPRLWNHFREIFHI